jgi:thiosulfate/3-mercaptopyruvate sulfurtransferase
LYAARLWWALGYYGHSKCKVLNGGFKKWFAEGRQVTTELRHVERGQFKVQDIRNEACATRIDLEAAIGSGDAVIWDVRSEGEHTGRDPRANKRGGHIPGAVHLEWRDLTNRKTDELLPADEIRSKFEALGITPDKKILTH